MTPKLPVARDIFERVASTFVGAVAVAWLSSGVGWQDTFNADNLRTYVGAGALAVFSLAKNFVATRINRRDGQATSASLDPAVQLQPESVAH